MKNNIDRQTIIDLGTIGLAAEQVYKIRSHKTPYHNWQHALHVVECINSMTDPDFDIEIYYALLIAAYWHDAVYLVGNSDNEEKSALALWTLCKVIDNPTLISICSQSIDFIRRTTVKHHLMNVNIPTPLGYLLDADLSSLGTSSFQEFVQNQDRIILENSGNIETDRYKCADFLKQFMTCREYIYHTRYGRTKWEANARYNIETYATLYIKKDEPVNLDTILNKKLLEIMERRVEKEMNKISIEQIITNVIEAHFKKFYGTK